MTDTQKEDFVERFASRIKQVFREAIEEVRRPDPDIIQVQERTIIRLRAALRAKGVNDFDLACIVHDNDQQPA